MSNRSVASSSASGGLGFFTVLLILMCLTGNCETCGWTTDYLEHFSGAHQR